MSSETLNPGAFSHATDLKNRIFFTIFLLIIYRLGTYVPLAGIDPDALKEIMSSSNSYGNDSTDGMTVGIGYNHEVANGYSIRAEITGTEFGDVSTDNGQTNKTNIKVEDMIGARGTISIVKSF